jgi:hypothetical protein
VGNRVSVFPSLRPALTREPRYVLC